MTGLDAIREAMALIRMTLNQYDANISERIVQLAKHVDVSPDEIRDADTVLDEDHWKLGSSQNLVNSRYAMKGAVWIDDLTRHNFHSDLRSFIRRAFPTEPLRDDGEETIMVRFSLCPFSTS